MPKKLALPKNNKRPEIPQDGDPRFQILKLEKLPYMLTYLFRIVLKRSIMKIMVQ